MFILYAIVIGLAVGLLAGGSPARLGQLQFRGIPIVIGGFLVQLVLFSDPVTARIGAAGPVLYVGSTLVVIAAIIRNIRIPGIPLVVLGAVSNLSAILANGGYMPAAPGAMAALGKPVPSVYSNSSVVADPALEPLTDLFAMPAWLPLANIFSIGDVLIATGIVITIVAAMRPQREQKLSVPKPA